jgi:hypothetical protein
MVISVSECELHKWAVKMWFQEKLYKLLLRVGRGVIQSKLEENAENAVQFRLMWIALLRRVRHRDEATEWIAERVG